MTTNQGMASVLALITMATPMQIVKHAHKIPSLFAADSNAAVKLRFNQLLVPFVERAVTTAAPSPIKTIADQTKTCLYISNEGVPIPNACVNLLKELDDCAKANRPSDRCFLLIGGKDEQQS